MLVSKLQNMDVISLEPKQLTDKEIDSRCWTRDLLKVLVSKDEGANVGVIVGSDYCLVCDTAKDSSWQYYQFPTFVEDCTIRHSHKHLWLVTRFGKLVTLDLHSNQWMRFKHNMHYDRILYADKNNVVVKSENVVYIIDAIRLQEDRLERIDSFSPVSFDSENKSFHITFLPEKNRFLVLEHRVLESSGNIVKEVALSSMGWDSQAEEVLSVSVVDGGGKLLFPFFVAFDKDKKELIYADLRQELIELKRQQLSLASTQTHSLWSLFDAFILDDELFVIVRESDFWALAKLEQCFKVLYKSKSQDLWRHISGRFLSLDSHGSILDVVSQKVTHDLPQSMLLRQLIQDEVERQKNQAYITKPLKLLPAVRGGAVVPNLDVFKVALRPSPFQIKEAAQEHLLDSVSSTTGNVAIFLKDKVHLLLADDLRFKYTVPGRWTKVTFDEQGRAWLCNDIGRYIALMTPETQEGHVFVTLGLELNKDVSKLSVTNIAAYDNNLILTRDDKSLTVYHYDGELLKEKWSLEKGKEKIEGVITGIKPDTARKTGAASNGWWILAKDWEKSRLIYLDNEKDSLQTIIQFRGELKLLGDRPEQVYLVYLDNMCHLYYTLDPYGKWWHVPLHDVLGIRNPQQDHFMKPISLHSVGDEIFILVEHRNQKNNSLLFMRVQADSAQLISAFHLSRPQVVSMHWGNWIVLHSNSPFAFNSAYATQSQVTDLPESEKMLFFFPYTGHFCTAPYAPYSIAKALYRSLASGTKRYPKFSL